MNINSFSPNKPGRLVKIADPYPKGHWAFVPNPLFDLYDLDLETVNLLQDAAIALGNLNGIGCQLKNPHILIGPFLRREAILSSRMEGTFASAQELVLFEVAPRRETTSAKEVHNYVEAMQHGLERIKELPICLRLIRELHEKLMLGVRGNEGDPGVFRNRQNFIAKPGQSIDQGRFVPPPAQEMMACLNDFEEFLNAKNKMPFLVELALLHYQFEAIHPFLDGNGRIGRLLIPLILCQKNVLSKPLLYMSAYFERNKEQYMDLLLQVSQNNNWVEWIRFFLKGIKAQSEDGVTRARKLLEYQIELNKRFHSPRTSALILKIIDELFASPAVSVAMESKRLGIGQRSCQQNIDKLVNAGILREATGQKRNRVYIAQKIIDIIEGPLE